MTDRRFSPGCLLGGCLLYLAVHALVILAGGTLLLFAVKGGLRLPTPPGATAQQWARYLLAVLAHTPPLVMIGVGGVLFLQVTAVWRGERWGVYGIALMVLSVTALSLWGLTNPEAILHTLLAVATALFPYLVLLWLVQGKWREMR